MSTVVRCIKIILVTALVAIVVCRAAVAQQYYWSNLAGVPGGSGSSDGVGANAQFYNPRGVAIDAVGNMYVADSCNHTIRKITPSCMVTTFAGSAGVSGSADGMGNAARFNQPAGVAVDANGNVYVADTGNYTVRKITTAGTVTTLAGNAGQYGMVNGSGSGVLFGYPSGVAVDSTGNLYVADSTNHVIRKVTSEGVVTTFAGTPCVLGSRDGAGTDALFNQPCAVAVDASDNVYVADTFNQTIRKITSAGVVTTLAGNAILAGALDGQGTLAMFNFPSGVAVDGSGNVYVADTSNQTIRKVTAAGNVTTLAGTTGAAGNVDGLAAKAQFNTPCGLVADASGNVYVADSGNQGIRKVTTNWGVTTTFAGSLLRSGGTNGTGTAARLNSPSAICVDGSGNVCVADTMSNSIRKVTSTGVVTTMAGLVGGLLDGSGTSAQLRCPYGIVAASGTLVYVADTFNNIIRQVTYNGSSWVASTIGGLVITGSGWGSTNGGIPGKTDGAGRVAQFSYPWGVGMDSSGSLYVADSYNQTIRQMVYSGSTWSVTTISGNAGQTGSANGLGNAARYSSPAGVTVDSGSNVYIADSGNHTIRKMSYTASGWTVTTLAGSSGISGTADGVGSNARFNKPLGVAVDSGSNVYVADSENNTIRRVAPDGTVTTLGGRFGVTGFRDGIGSAGLFSRPSGVAVDSSGAIYVADSGNNRICIGLSVGTGTASLVAGTSATLSGAAFPNGVSTSVYFQYGTTSAYGSTSGVQNIGSGTDFVNVNAPLGGLTPNTDYHYRLVIVNSYGTFYGTDQVLTTPPTVIPTISSAATATGTNGVVFTNYQIIANNSPTSYSANSLPAGLNLHPITGLISGTPTQTGTFSVILGATNVVGTGTKVLTVSVVDMQLPAFTSGSTAGGAVNCNFNYQIQASPFVTSYSATELPSGLTLTGSSGLISGILTETGTFAFTVGASNQFGTSTMTVTTVVGPGYRWTNFAGKPAASGSSDGNGTAARFYTPAGCAVTSGSDIILADSFNHCIRKISPTADVTLIAGTPGVSGSADGTGSGACFNYPTAVALDRSGNIYVADSGNNSIRKITPGGVVTTFAGLSGASGSTNGTGTAARFSNPYALAIDSGTNIYVADSNNHLIRKITPAAVVSTLAGAGTSGSTDGTGTGAKFYFPKAITIDSGNILYVADTTNRTIRKVTPGRVVTTLVGKPGTSGTSNGVGSAGTLNSPYGIAVDSGSNLFIADRFGHSIRMAIRSGTNWMLTTIGGMPATSGTVDGTGYAARFNGPNGVAVTSTGDVIITDASNHRVSIGTPTWPPIISAPLSVTGTTGVIFSYSIPASNNPTSYSATGLPSGLAINTTSGLISGTPALTGSFALTVSASNLGGTDFQALTLFLVRNYAVWKTQKFTTAELSNSAISGDNAAPGGDEIPNLMKYALGLDPKTRCWSAKPRVGTLSVDGYSYLTITYAPTDFVPDVTLTVEVSGDLKHWYSGPAYITPVDTGDPSSITIQDLFPMEDYPCRFIRLKVTR